MNYKVIINLKLIFFKVENRRFADGFLFFMRLFIRFSSHWRTKYADGFAKDGFYIKIRLAHGLATLWSAERIKCRVKYAVGEGLAPPVIKCRVQNAELNMP